MATINRPMYEGFAARHLGIKGPGALTSMEEGIMGTLPLDLSADPLYWQSQGFKIMSGFQHSDAVAGQYSWVGLSIENATEQTLCRIINVDFSWSGTVDHSVYIYRGARTDFSPGPGKYAYSTDTRVPETQHSQAIMLQGAAAAFAGTNLGIFTTTKDPDLPVSQMPMIVSPAQAITFWNTAANDEIRAHLTWVEVPAYKGEV